jgi:hypothetical protein
MILIDPADLPAIEGTQSCGGGTRANRTAVAKYRRQIGFNGILQLAFKAGERAEAFRRRERAVGDQPREAIGTGFQIGECRFATRVFEPIPVAAQQLFDRKVNEVGNWSRFG